MKQGQIEEIKDRYRKHATSYDTARRASDWLRPLAVARLSLKPGDTVLDLGCGTGLSFGLLEQGVGREGRIIGVELSPDMLAVARGKVEEQGWANVTLIAGSVEETSLPGPVDAVLTFFTPEITISDQAMAKALAALGPEGRLVAAGVKRAEGLWGIFFNLFFQFRYRTWRWVGVRGVAKRLWGGGQPYLVLERMVESLERQDYMGRCAYIAYAQKGPSVPSSGKELAD